MYRLDKKLSPEEFGKTFLELKTQNRVSKPNPWNELLREGKLTKEQLQGWAKDHYYFKRMVPAKEYSILRDCPYPDVRRKWLSKAIEEEGEDLIGGEHGPHPDYWLKFCEGIGLNRDYVINSEPLPAVRFAMDWWVQRASKSWLIGVAMSETADVAKGMQNNLATFRKHYSWIPEWALEFYVLHAEVDVDHARIGVDILTKYCDTRELQEECINAGLRFNDIQRVMADAVYLAYVVQGMTCQETGGA